MTEIELPNHSIWFWIPLHYHRVVWGHLGPKGAEMNRCEITTFTPQMTHFCSDPKFSSSVSSLWFGQRVMGFRVKRCSRTPHVLKVLLPSSSFQNLNDTSLVVWIITSNVHLPTSNLILILKKLKWMFEYQFQNGCSRACVRHLNHLDMIILITLNIVFSAK